MNEAAQQLGRLGGIVTSDAKAAAARSNGCTPCRPGKRRGRPPMDLQMKLARREMRMRALGHY